jgi:hypothetical protein
MRPLWEIEFTAEAKFYFIDSGDDTGNLLGEIELLRYYSDALPPEGWTEVEPGLFRWEILNHLVYYRKRGNTIVVAVVKPL